MDYKDLKIGDKIRYLRDGRCLEKHHLFSIGDILTITDDCIGIPDVIDNEGARGSFRTDERNWELVTEDKPKRTNFNNCAIRIKNPEESKKVQEALFELGYSWFANGVIVSHVHSNFLHTWDDKYLTRDDTNVVNLKEVTPLEIIEAAAKKEVTGSFGLGIGACGSFGGLHIESISEFEEQSQEENKMELKEINKKNIEKAVEKVKKDQATEEQEYAEVQYLDYQNQKDRIERNRKALTQEEKEMNEKYAVFITKSKK